jgi:hypothetical protein
MSLESNPPPPPPPDNSNKLPPEIRDAIAKLQPWMESAGMEVPKEVANSVPQIYLGDRIGLLAHELAQHLRASGLYRAGEELVTVDEGTGRFALMKASRFVSWVDDWVSFWKPAHGEKKYVSMNRQKAEEILASDAFRCKIPVLNGINPVKLPVRRRSGVVELLQPGYDAESGIFTLQAGLDYSEEMDPDEARLFILEMLKYFPFDGERSKAVHVAAMLTVYMMGMMPAGARPPMLIWNANQVASGKTRLAQMCLIPVFGGAAVATWWERVEDFKKEMDSAAQDFSPYLFFDDQTGFLKSGMLNSWITASRWAGRVMGGKDRFSVPLRAVTLVTGNQLTYSDDLYRRSLIADLFQPVQYDQRVLPEDAIDMTEEWLADEPNRSKILAALWALVRHAEVMEQVRPAQLARKIGSFEGWCRVVPKVVVHAALGDPTEKPAAAQGNPLLADARELARIALDRLVEGRRVQQVKLADLVPLARKAGLFVEALGTLDDVFRDLDAGKGRWKPTEVVDEDGDVSRREATPEEKREQAAGFLDRAMATRFGATIKRLMNGLMFVDGGGRNYQFGSREGARQATYVCVQQ